MSELLRLQEETKKMLRSVLLPNKEGLLLSGGSQAGVGQAAEASSQDGGNYHLSCSHNVIIVLDETRIKD